MKKTLRVALVTSLLLIVMQAIGSSDNADIDLINKSIDISNGAEARTRMDRESARQILAHLGSTEEQWERFLTKIQKGQKGAIVTALHVIEFATDERQRDLKFALQETLIDLPDVVLAATVTTDTPLHWACGIPAYENHDLVDHLTAGRIEVLEEMLAAMNSKQEALRQLYSKDLRPVAEECLALVRKTAAKVGLDRP